MPIRAPVHGRQCRVNGSFTGSCGFVGYALGGQRPTEQMQTMASVLKTGMIGHVYRALRDGGVLAIATGVWMVASTIYPALTGERATARVANIETGCAFNSELGAVESMTGLTADCSSPALVAMGLASEMKIANLNFQSQLGALYSAEVPFDSLNDPNLQTGDTVVISYARDDPQSVHALPGLWDCLCACAPILAGIMALGLLVLARRAENYRSDINAEIAELERAYRSRQARG